MTAASSKPVNALGRLLFAPLACVLLSLIPPGLDRAVAQEMQVIELHHRIAEDVIPNLRPLLDPDGVLTGMDSTLFVRTSPENFEQIRKAVELLDRRLRELTISVGQGTVQTVQDTDVRGSATVGNDDVQVGVNRPPADGTSVAVQARHSTQRTDLHDVSSVRTIEGSEAFVAIGQVAPVSRTGVAPGYHGPVVYRSTEFVDASTGFYATARLNGDRVTLEISPRQQRLRYTPYGPAVETASSTSVVSGRLGEWLPLGAVRESSSSNASGLLIWGNRSTESQYSAWVKVDEVP